MTFCSLNLEYPEADLICSIESSYMRMKLMNGCYGPFTIDVENSILIMVFHYCKKRGKIMLLQYSDDNDESLTIQQKKLKDFDFEFLQYIHRYHDVSLFMDFIDAALILGVKSLYDLVFGQVVDICCGLTSKQLSKAFKLDVEPHPERISSCIWAFDIILKLAATK